MRKTYISCLKEDLEAEGGREKFIKDTKTYLDAVKSELDGVCVWCGAMDMDDCNTDGYSCVTTSYDDLYDDLIAFCRGFSIYKDDDKTYVECDFEDGFAKLEGRRLLPDAERKYRVHILERDDVSPLEDKVWRTEMFRSDEDSRPLDIDKAKKNMKEREK